MARKPNYNFEKAQREKNKAAKKAERQAAKAEKAAARKAENKADDGNDVPAPGSGAERPDQ